MWVTKKLQELRFFFAVFPLFLGNLHHKDDDQDELHRSYRQQYRENIDVNLCRKLFKVLPLSSMSMKSEDCIVSHLMKSS